MVIRTIPSRADTEQLARRLEGHLISPQNPGHDEARTVFNGMISKRPAMIARVAGTNDVVHCIQFARAHDLPLSVRGGGRNVAGNGSWAAVS